MHNQSQSIFLVIQNQIILDTKKKRDVSTGIMMNEHGSLSLGVDSNIVVKQHTRRKRSISKYLLPIKTHDKTKKLLH